VGPSGKNQTNLPPQSYFRLYTYTAPYSTLFGGHDTGNGHICSRRPHQWCYFIPHQWAQSDPGLGEWVKENGTLKVLELVLLRPTQDLWAGKTFALVVKNKAHAQALAHVLSRGAMPVESDVAAAVNTKEFLTTLAILPDRSYMLEIIFDLPIGFPINNLSLSRNCCPSPPFPSKVPS